MEKESGGIRIKKLIPEKPQEKKRINSAKNKKKKKREIDS